MKNIKGKVITVTSVKGGVGKSTFTLSLAGVMSKRKLKTVILDLDFSSGVISASLNLIGINDIFDLTDDMMNGRFENIEDYIRKYDEYIGVISAPVDPRRASKVHISYIQNIIKQLEYKYDVVLIDTNHSLTGVNTYAFDESDEILYLITNDLMDLKNMRTMRAIYENMNVDNYKIILNRKYSHSVFEVETVLDKNVDYIMPKSYWCENIQKYLYEGKILTLEKNIKELESIVDDIL